MNRLGAFAFSIATAVGVGIAGCSSGGSIPAGNAGTASGLAAKVARASASACPCYSVLYNFSGTLNGGTDGDSPTGFLIYANGLFYGETELGGTGRADGTVYSMTPSGTETVLYSFQGGRDGSLPQNGGLLNDNGTLYGVTSSGGSNAYGTMFSVTPAGTETVLHSFGSVNGGRNPQASLIDVNGVFFGTTYDGGTLGAGTVFRAGPAGNALTVHNFGGGADGADPQGLISYNGLLYGTTFKGGAHGFGTVFSMAPDGTNETILHSFARDGIDGAGPISRLTELNGTLYGATDSGGVHDRGTIFSISPSGSEKVLLSFNGGFNALGGVQHDSGSGGAHPSSDLTIMNGALFGMTNGGGNYQRGMIFRITANGTLTALHSFGGPGDTAQSPVGGRLYPLNGALYGTTQSGHNTLGVFFSIKP